MGKREALIGRHEETVGLCVFFAFASHLPPLRGTLFR